MREFYKEYKIKVNAIESMEVQELLFKLGYKWPFTGQHVAWLSKPWLSTGVTGQIYWHEENQREDFYRCTLITLEELRELVDPHIEIVSTEKLKEATTDIVKQKHNTSCTYQFELAFHNLQDTPELRKIYWSALGQLCFDSNDQVIPPELEDCPCCKAGEQCLLLP